MDEKSIRTSTKQRIIIGFIAVLLFVSTIMVYALIVLNGEKSKKGTAEQNAELKVLAKELDEKKKDKENAVKALNDKYFETLKSARSSIKSYNVSRAQNDGLKSIDLSVGTGATLEKESKYLAYYFGWCSDESVFDSSFDDNNNPKSLKDPLDVTGSGSLITGWSDGLVGAKLGGVRELHIPSTLAYGDTKEICGGKNSPLYFVILPFEDEAYKKATQEYQTVYRKYLNLQSEIRGTGSLF